MATKVTLDEPTIQVTRPPELEIELNSKEENRSTSIFTIESVESSPLGSPNPEHDLIAQGNSVISQRNSLDSHRNSIQSHRNSISSEEMHRNRKRHQGKVYNILTLEDSVCQEEPFYGGSEHERQLGTNNVSGVANNFSESAIETKRHTYEHMHYVEKAIFLGSVVLLGLLSVVLLTVGRLVLEPISNEKTLIYTSFDPQSGGLVLSRNGRSVQCTLSSAGAQGTPPEKFDEEGTAGSGEGVHLKYEYKDSSFTLAESSTDSGVCTHLVWDGDQTNLFTSLELCFSLREGHWYGGYESYSQQWPLNYTSTQLNRPFLSGNYIRDRLDFGPVLHPAWFSSEGAAIIADTEDRFLHVQLMNQTYPDNHLCLRASFDGYLLSSPFSPNLTLNVNICLFDTILQANKYFLQTVIDVDTTGVDSTDYLPPHPIWSTWAQYKRDVNQSQVTELLNSIIKNRFNASIIEIDDRYSTKYGDLDFDTSKFPDAKSMIDEIHANGIKVSTWIHPFANVDSQVFQQSLTSLSDETQDRWMFCRGDNHTLGVVRWWRGYAGLFDLTKQKTFDWFVERLNNFSLLYSIDTFSFDAGESSYLPQCDLPLHPNKFAQRYVEVASRFSWSDIRVGYNSQRLPLMVRLLDKESTWGLDNGLHSVLTSTLTLSILGYPFVLPDTIGGNNLEGDASLIDPELFTRWVGLNAFLPVMQFSSAPWQYGGDVLDYSREMSSLHYQLFNDVINCLGRMFVTTKEPIIRPLWWSWPLDPRTYTINTQFLIGDVYLVSPALFKGQTECSVYLPAGSGTWQDVRNGDLYPSGEEGNSIKVSCQLYEIPPYFKNGGSQFKCI